MGEFFSRDFIIKVGDVRIDARDARNDSSFVGPLPPGASSSGSGQAAPSLRVEFNVEKYRKVSDGLNTASVTIHNLAAKTRALIQKDEKIPVTIEAGYVGLMKQIFSGTVIFAENTRGDTNWLTSIQASNLNQTRVKRSFKEGTSIVNAIRSIAECTGLKTEDFIKKVQAHTPRKGIRRFAKGFTATGKCIDALEGLCESYGIELGIDDDELVALSSGSDFRTPTKVITLTPQTGIIGSPSVGDKGILNITTLFHPEIRPADKFEVATSEIGGFFRVDRVSYTGDTGGDTWNNEIEAPPIQ